MIYDVVMFFIERGSEIMALVNAVIDTITAVADGNVKTMADMIEDVLARAIPIAISFLAALLGLGGISKKVKGIIETFQEKVDNALDKVFQSDIVQKVAGFIKGAIAKFKKMIEKGINKVKGALGMGDDDEDDKKKPDERTKEEKQNDLDQAMAEADQVIKGNSSSLENVEAELPAIQEKYKLRYLKFEQDTDATYYLDGKVNPRKRQGYSFKGGKKNQRDNWYGFNDKGFQRWWHRVGKKEAGGYDFESREEVEQIYNDWVEQGKPIPK